MRDRNLKDPTVVAYAKHATHPISYNRNFYNFTKYYRTFVDFFKNILQYGSVVRFGIVGILNTIVGYVTIITGLHLGLGDYFSNFLGYTFGMTCSFLLNRVWVFQSSEPINSGLLNRFAFTFALSYGINLLILHLARAFGYTEQPAIHILAMAGYSVCFYQLSRTIVFKKNGNNSPSLRDHFNRYYPDVALLIVAALTFFAIRNVAITHDVVWQFWIAREIIEGSSLYRDIMEVNPPLWFWSAIPIQYFSQVAHLQPLRVLLATIVAMGAFSVILLDRLTSLGSKPERLLLMVAAFLFTVPLPLYDIGQREQLALICALPYAGLITRRVRGERIPTALAVGVATYASYGFALKHYFCLVPIALELWLLLRQRRSWTLARPEILTLTSISVIYVLAIMKFVPDFFLTMVPMVQIAYSGYETPLLSQILRPAPFVWILSLICIFLYRKNINDLTISLIICFIGFFLAYFIQKKGWPYHAIAATGSILIATTICMLSNGIKKLHSYPLGIISIFFAVFFSYSAGSYSNINRQIIQRIVTPLAPGDSVAVWTIRPTRAWPMIMDQQLSWTSPYFGYWMLPAIALAENTDPENKQMLKLASKIQYDAFYELSCKAPAMIIIDRDYFLSSTLPIDFDIREFFFRNQMIRSTIRRNYREKNSTSSFYVYRINKENKPLPSRKLCH
ncbi:MAG: hypothetical protein DI547_04000 [Sphingobium sp.]|nr:MAG: hypothetical protein DI547_04000 [Sphingobium sp.]